MRDGSGKLPLPQAPGVLTVAISFASQTAMSNLISGVFLSFEQPFQGGDAISVDGVSGEVLSIELLSVRIRTWDNQMVRVPSSKVLQGKTINLNHYPIRRVELEVVVGYGADVDQVRDLLIATATENPLCLADPAPAVTPGGFTDTAMKLTICAWATTANFGALKYRLMADVCKGLEDAGVPRPALPWVGRPVD